MSSLGAWTIQKSHHLQTEAICAHNRLLHTKRVVLRGEFRDILLLVNTFPLMLCTFIAGQVVLMHTSERTWDDEH